MATVPIAIERDEIPVGGSVSGTLEESDGTANLQFQAKQGQKYLIEVTWEGMPSVLLSISDPPDPFVDAIDSYFPDSIPSVRERVLASQLGSDSVARLDMVETKLNDFIAEPDYCPLGDMPPSDVGDYQKMFQALATVSSSPRTAKELMAGILLLASGAEKDGMERGGTVC